VEYRIIDCDQHVIEPPDLWDKWLPARFQDRAPRLVRDASKKRRIFCENAGRLYGFLR
jgi:predicted TIM-barrel fold metal-dependent hydrolase